MQQKYFRNGIKTVPIFYVEVLFKKLLTYNITPVILTITSVILELEY